jgi:hypothetical protein
MRKISNRVLLAAAAVIVLALLFSAFYLKEAAMNPGKPGAPEYVHTGPVTNLAIPQGAFDGIWLVGMWDVGVRYGKTVTGAVTVPLKYAGRVNASIGREGLMLVSGVDGKEKSEPPHAEIVLPEFRHLTANGPADLRVEGFTNANLSVAAKQGLRLRGKGNVWSNLILNSTAYLDADLSENVAMNAGFTLKGLSGVKIRIGGGRFFFDAEGITRLEWTGKASDRQISGKGIFSENDPDGHKF